MMSLDAILDLTGHLTDQAGANSARERFRRFLASDISHISALRSLIAEARQSIDEQAPRALGDLVVALGRFVGCDVAFGGYDRTSTGATVTGTWSSPRMRMAVDVRILRDAPDPDGAARADLHDPRGHRTNNVVSIMAGVTRLSVVVYREAAVASDGSPEMFNDGVPIVTVERLVALADEVDSGRLTCEAALDALLDLDSSAPTTTQSSQPEPAADCWIATIVDDEGTAPELMVQKVIRGRKVLPASRLGMFVPSARPGDRVCFFVGGLGVVGWGRLKAEIPLQSAPVRRADRFAAVFGLADLVFHPSPVPLDSASLAQRLATRSPIGVAGSFLSLISADDFRILTARLPERDYRSV